MVDDMIRSIKKADKQIIENMRLLMASAGDEKYVDEWRLLAIVTERLIEQRSGLSYILTRFGVYGV